MGLVATVDRFLAGSDAEDRAMWERQAARVVEALAGVPGVRAHVLREGQQAAPDFSPRAYVDLEGGRAVEEVVRALREGEPSVVVRRGAKGIVVDPMTLMPGEEEVVGRRLREALTT
jgi:hypothetical protein